MKLVNIENQKGYLFILTFENGESKDTDLRDLIEKYVSQAICIQNPLIQTGDAWNLIMAWSILTLKPYTVMRLQKRQQTLEPLPT
jgi:hypothetical protein